MTSKPRTFIRTSRCAQDALYTQDAFKNRYRACRAWLREPISLSFNMPLPATLDRDKVVRPRLALLILVAFLCSQWLLPGLFILDMAVAQQKKAAQTTKKAVPAPTGRAPVSAPVWYAQAQKRFSQRGKPKPSEPLRGCKNCDVDMRALNLSRPPSERELRRAGQLGGALSPTKNADVQNLARELDEKGASDLEKQVKIQHLEDINLSFGRAIQEWNKHNFRPAAILFKQHIQAYPDSPWAGEALLHLGCDAKYNGRFSEAQDTYSQLVQTTSGNKAEPSFEIHQKAKLRWADLDISLGRLDDAAAKLKNLLETDTDWRRQTWAQHWLHNVAIYKQNARDLRACGTQALSVVLASLGKKEAGRRLAQMKPKSSNGFSLGELERLARANGLPMRGFRAPAERLAALPMPLLIHYNFEGPKPASGSHKAAPARTEAPFSAAPLGVSSSQVSSSRRPSPRGSSPFRVAQRAGHFLVVNGVNQEKGLVNLYDPQEKRRYYMAFADLNKEWSGTGLVRTGGAAASAHKSKTKTASRDIESGAESKSGAEPKARLAWLSKAEMSDVVGGCCGIARPMDSGGNQPTNQQTNSGCNGFGSPLVSVNRLNLNMFITDTPLWYSAPIGPDVLITMNYNSQDALNQNNVFGNKWVFNYGSYAVEDTAAGGGVVTIFMPDGAQHNYYPDGQGGYTPQKGIYNVLRKRATTRYELTGQSGDKFIYDIPQGTTSLQPFLVELRDRFGYALTFGYDAQVRLKTITDAQGKVTRLSHDELGHITRVDDPFGRHAAFKYDTNGNMVEVVDMEGNGFQYVYDERVMVTQLNTAQGAWQYGHDFPYSNSQGRVYNAQYYLTITDPLGEAEKWNWDGSMWVENSIYHIDKKGYRTNFWIRTVIDGRGKITSVDHPNGLTERTTYDSDTGFPNAVTDARGKTTQITYNGQGQVATVTNPMGAVTRINYAANGVDVLSTTDALGQVAARYTYNDKHQVTAVTDAFNATASFTYTAWGAPASVTDAAGRVLTYNYDSATQQTTSVYEGSVEQGRFTYDEVGRVRTATDAGNITLTYDYNDLDKPTRVTYPDGTFTEVEYACCGLPGMTTDRAGRKTYYDYDPLKRLARTQDAQGNAVHMDYDARGQMIRLNDTRGTVTSFAYDTMGRPIRKSYSDGTSESISYNTAENMVTRRDTAGRLTRSIYDDLGNLARIDYPNTPDVELRYDALNRPIRMLDGLGVTTYAYDALSRPQSVDGPFANDAVSYAYDTLGRRSTMQVQDGASNGPNTQVSYSYDALGRLEGLNSSASGYFQHAYIGNTGRLTWQGRPNGVNSSLSYDGLGRLSVMLSEKNNNGGLVSRYDYGYDNRDVRTFMEQRVGTNPMQHVNYSYDTTNQLLREVSTEAAPQLDNTYAYDAMGNRSSVQATGTDIGGYTNSYSANRLNQILSHSTTSSGSTNTRNLSYDPSGNLTRQTLSGGSANGGIAYSYDEADRLVQVARANETTGINEGKSEFVYDGLNRKVISREFTWSSATSQWVQQSETRRVYDGMNVVQERDGTNTTKAFYTRGMEMGGGIGGLLARTVKTSGQADSSYFYHYDGSGNVVQLTDENQNVVANYRYDAFGVAIVAFGSQAGQPYRYSSKEWHSSAQMYDYGFRFYSPGMGRWLNRDPIAEAGGLNLYGFVSNNPTNSIDRYGLILDTVADVGFIGYDIYKLVTDPCNRGENAMALGMDVLGTLIPFATGLGAASRVASHADEAFDTYAGVRQASQTLQDAGVPREIRKQVLETFERETIKVRTAGIDEFGLRYYDGVNAKDKGRFLAETFPMSRQSLAIKPEWNNMTHLKQWQIRPGSTIIEGRAASQGPGLPGGQVQKYLMNLDDLF